MHKNATKLVQLMVEKSFFSRFFGLFDPFFSFFFGPTSVIFKKKLLATLIIIITEFEFVVLEFSTFRLEF